MNILKSALIVFSKALFPNRCNLCGEVIEFNASVCEACKNPPEIKQPLCIYCASSKEDCICKQHKNEYKQIVAPYYYKDSITGAVNNFKNNDMMFLSDRFCSDIFKCISDNYKEICFDAVTYIPLHPFREHMRGFNQSELLANGIADRLHIPVLPLLKKMRYTGTQHKKNASERKADVFGSYDVNDNYKNALDNKVILLIDDVKTTGSTLNECAKMLKIYGAQSVYCASFAITKKEK